MSSCQVYSVVDRKDSFVDRFKRDSSFGAIREGVMRSGLVVTDIYSAGFVAAQEYAAKRWGKTAEAFVRLDGNTFGGGVIFRAEIWTHRRSRFVDEMRFALQAVDE